MEWERDKQMAELKGQGLAWQAREGGGGGVLVCGEGAAGGLGLEARRVKGFAWCVSAGEELG